MKKVQALVGCQNEYCAAEVSYPLDMVHRFNSQPICQVCYEDGDYGERNKDGSNKVRWDDLPPIKLSDLSEQRHG